MTDILFVQNYYEQNIGIMSISSLLKQHGFTADVAIGNQKDILKKISELEPKVIGFYCTTGFHHKNIKIASEIKKVLGDKILTILGGPHPTFVPESIETEGVDMICRGEGEYALLELIESLHAGKDYTGIQNLSVKKYGKIYRNELRPLCDVNILPYPDRELYKSIKHVYNNKRQEVMFSRGCYFDCTFCSNHAYKELYKGKGSYVRLRSISNVMEELEAIKKRYQPSCFFFHDDVFIFDKNYCLEFLKLYQEKINLPYACLVRANQLTDDLAGRLKNTGCYFISFGIESGSPRLRNMVMNKNIEDESILQCAKLLHKHRISFATLNMIGLPGETLSEAWQTVEINMRAKPNWAWFSIYQPLPKTALGQLAIDKGYIKGFDVAVRDANFHESGVILRENPEGKKMLRLKNSANIVIKIPLLKVLVKKAILNLPFDRLYAFIDNSLYFIFYYLKLTSKQKLKQAVYSLYFVIKSIK